MSRKEKLKGFIFKNFQAEEQALFIPGFSLCIVARIPGDVAQIFVCHGNALPVV